MIFRHRGSTRAGSCAPAAATRTFLPIAYRSRSAVRLQRTIFLARGGHSKSNIMRIPQLISLGESSSRGVGVLSQATVMREGHLMSDSTKRGRGRPKLSKTTPFDLGAEIWVRVGICRIRTRILTGRTATVAKTCEALMAGAGIRSAIGGDINALAAANHTGKNHWRRFRFDEKGPTLIADMVGSIFITHKIESSTALHARYSEANKLATNPLVRLNWMNLGRQMLGRPLRTPRWGNPLQPKAWSLMSDGTLVARAN
jgi:hypothetical protein